MNRHDLKNRLEDAGCTVNTHGIDWLSSGNFVDAIDTSSISSTSTAKSSTTNTPLLAVKRGQNGNIQVLLTDILDNIQESTGENTMSSIVAGVGEIFVNEEILNISKKYGKNCYVELYDATAADSPIPQYSMARIIP